MQIEMQIHRAFIEKKKTLALAESCTGGAISARLVAIPDASKYFLGSIVAYCDKWKKQFLHVAAKHSKSREAVIEMVQGLFQQTDADFAVAISGDAPGLMFVAIAERGKPIDVKQFQAPEPRSAAIAFAVQFTLEELFKKI